MCRRCGSKRGDQVSGPVQNKGSPWVAFFIFDSCLRLLHNGWMLNILIFMIFIVKVDIHYAIDKIGCFYK
jgi:hypothetical protein